MSINAISTMNISVGMRVRSFLNSIGTIVKIESRKGEVDECSPAFEENLVTVKWDRGTNSTLYHNECNFGLL